MVYIDIPYLIQEGGCSDNELSKRMKRLRSVDLAKIKNGIDYSILKELVRVMKKINIFIWCNKQQYYDIMHFFKTNTNAFDCEILTWEKKNPSPLTNNVWLPNLEYCLYFRESGVKLNDGYELKSKTYHSPINKADKDEYGHPTIKPLELVKRHLLHTTQPNDVVFDPFSGSGTTAVACIETNRNFIAFELEKDYFEKSIDRIKGISQLDKKMKAAGISTIFDFMEE